MHKEPESHGTGSALDTVLADYMRRVDRGEKIDQAAFIAAHPELADDLRAYFSHSAAVGGAGTTATANFADNATPRSGLEVRCPNCHAPMEVAADTALTDLTCSACGSHFSLVDQSQATRMAPSLSKMGRFELIERLGVGGFGSVWKARDKELDRTVAIKIPRAGGMTPEEQEKFFREARAAAQLKHSSIVSVHEVGRDGDSVYIVSDFVRGVTLGDWLTDPRLTNREAAELCAKIADALHHAHEQGVVHRDLKPANIMMDYDGEPHLMDFGLARRMSGEVTLTLDGQVIGTPAYMSPEQALGEAHTADRRSDVYSLGVILFQLLTNELPFRGNARMLIKHVAHDEPPSPRQFNAKIAKDLETITLKCLEKSPQRRYQTSQDLSDELRRFLSGEPIHARPIGRLNHAWRWGRRHPLITVSGVAAVLALWTVTITIAYFSIRAQRNDAIVAQQSEAEQRNVAEKQTHIAVQQRTEAEWQSRIAQKQEQLAQAAKQAEEYEAYIAQIGLANAKINENAYDFALKILDASQPALRNWEWGRLTHLCQLSDATYRAAGPVDAVAFSPDGSTIASGDLKGKVTIRNTKSGAVQFEVPHGQYVLAVAFAPDGRKIATGSSDKTIQILDSSNGKTLRTLSGHTDGVLCVRFSPDGRQLLSGSYDDTARIWDIVTGNELQVLKGHSWWVWAAEFSPDGKRIVTAGQDGKAIVWEKGAVDFEIAAMEVNRRSASRQRTENSRLFARIAEFTGHDGAVYSAQFSPDGKSIVTGGHDKQVMIWNPDEVKPMDIGKRLDGEPDAKANVVRLAGHDGPVRSVAFSPNCKLVVSGSADNSIRVWDVQSGEAIKTLRGHGGIVRSCVFSPDGQLVLSGGDDDSVRLWNVKGYQEVRVLHATVFSGHEDAVLSAQYSPDGQRIVTASRDRTASLWDATTGGAVKHFAEGHEFLVSDAVFYPDGRHLATAAGDNSVRIWNLVEGTQTAVLAPTGRIGTLAVSPDGKWIATSSLGPEIKIWNANNGELTATLRGHAAEVSALAFSPASDRLASGDGNGLVQLWKRSPDGAQWASERPLVGHTEAITALRFSANDDKLIVASGDRTCGQWDLATGQEMRGLVLKHPGWVYSLDLSPDGALALTTCDDGAARAWRLADATTIAAVKSPGRPFNSAGFSPDGTTAVLVSSEDKIVRLWNISFARAGVAGAAAEASAIEVFLDFNKLGGEVWAAKFAPDGRHILTVGGNDAALWDIGTRRPVVRYSPHGAVASAVVSPNGKLVATGSWDHSAKIWEIATGRAIRKLDGAHAGYVNSVAFSPDGSQLLTASDDFTARLWNVETGRPTGIVFKGHTARVLAASFSPDGTRVFTVSDDKTARLWDRATGKPIGVPLAGHNWAVLCGEFSADSRRIITGSQDKSAIIWDAATGAKLVTFEGHSAAVTSCAFSPDGTRIITGSQDNTAKLWDASTGKEVLSLPGHTKEVSSVSFSPDGLNILTASRDGKAIIWLANDWRGDRQNVPGTLRAPSQPESTPAGPNTRDDLFGAGDASPTESQTTGPRDQQNIDPTHQRSSAPSSSQKPAPGLPPASRAEQTKRAAHVPAATTSAPAVAPAPVVVTAAPATLPAYAYEGFVRAQDYATELKASIARLHKDKDAEIAAYTAFRDVCAKRADFVRQLYELDRRGGEAEKEAMARVHYHRAEAELAALRGQHDLELKWLKLRMQSAKDLLGAVQAAYENDRVPLDFLLEAQEEMGRSVIRLAGAGAFRDPEIRKLFRPELANDTEIKIDALVTYRDACVNTWRKTFALYEANRRGGEAEKEAIARVKYFEASTDLAELAGEYEKSAHPDRPLNLDPPAGQLPTRDTEQSDPVLAASELAVKSARDALRAVRAAYENDYAPFDMLSRTHGLLTRLEVAYAKRIGDEAAVVPALADGRNVYLDTWRKIHALYETGRRGGEAEKEAYARALYFESQAKLLETIGDDPASLQKYKDVLGLPPGQLPADWIATQQEFSNRTSTEKAYRNALNAVEDVIAAMTAAADHYFMHSFLVSELSMTRDRYIELVIVSPQGVERARFRLIDEAALDPRRLFRPLPDNHYRLYVIQTDNNTRRLLIDVYVRGGRIVDPADVSEGSRDRLPIEQRAIFTD